MNKLILGLPKGSLQESTFLLIQKAGFKVSTGSRSYFPRVDDPEIEARLIRAQEISRYTERGMLDAGITGYDWIVENGSDVHEVSELIYAKQGLRPVRWVVAVPADSPIRSVKDLEGKRIATEAVGLMSTLSQAAGSRPRSSFLGRNRGQAPSWLRHRRAHGNQLQPAGKQPAHRGDGAESTTRFIANKKAWKIPGNAGK